MVWRGAAWLQMEVGIEDCLHIEFEYDKAKYHLKVSPGVIIK